MQQRQKQTTRVRVVETLPDGGERLTAVYARVTAEESVLADQSLPNQKRRALEVCAEHGWPVAKLYVEPRHVGGDLGPEHRPALRELLDDIEAGRIARVLCRHTDRLWRDTGIQDRLLRIFAKQNVELFDFAAQHDYRSAHGRFSTIVLGAAAQLEKELTGERIVEMKRGKAHAGKVGGGPAPYGYTSQARVKHELVAAGMTPEAAGEEACRRLPAAKRLYIDEKEAAVVRHLFDLYTQEHLGCRRLTERLNDEGHRRRSGLLWVTSKVTAVLTCPVVAGWTTYDEDAYRARQKRKRRPVKQAYFEGEHEAIIARDQWNEALALRQKNASLLRTTTRTERVFSLTGILKCGTCGGHMMGKSSGRRFANANYYWCAARKYRGVKYGCAAPLVPAAVVEGVVVADLERLLSSPEFIHEFMVKANERLRAHRPDAVRTLAELEEQLQATGRAVIKFTARYEGATDAETEEVAWTKLKEVMTRKKALDARVAEARIAAAAAAAPSVTLKGTENYLAALRTHLGPQSTKLRHLLSILQRRHDLRVRVLDGRRLVLTLRLDESSVTNADASEMRNRLIVVPSGDEPDVGTTHILKRELALPGRETPEAWAARENASNVHQCQCGCGRAVTILPFHRAKGIPRFRKAHHRMFMTSFVAQMNARGLLTIAQAAMRLTMGETTLRRKAVSLGLTEERMPWGNRQPMRLYRAAEIDSLKDRDG